MSDPRPHSVLLLDVDGTLLDYQAQLPESAGAAVREARSRGHRVYLCTGRSRAEIYPSLWDLGLDGLIGGNGSYVESDGEVVWHQVLPRDVVERAVVWMEERGLAFYLESNTGLFGTEHLPERTAVLLGGATEENIAQVRQGFPHMIYDPTQGRDEVNKISFVLEPGLDLAALAESFAGEAGIDTWSLTGRGPEFGEFGQLGVHKGAAVRRLAEHLGMPVSSLIGFGDARSDVELLTACGTGVAMGNAPDELLAVADVVTDRADEDGLVKAFVRLGLIDG